MSTFLIHCFIIDFSEMFDIIASGEIAKIRTYFQSNNKEGVHTIFSKLHDSLDEETFRAKTIPLLYEVVERDLFHPICR